eukprot:GHVN01037241.1.p2 GENE.GHVN01037241.1~~GHVN01037241.1.p2  ORF type:complete len:153 (+),score=8.89 GHVN01037241.1:887-1345(+)
MEGASWTAMVDQDPLSQGIPNTTFIRGSRTSHLHKFCGGFSASTAASDPPQEATYLLSGRSLLNSTIGAEVANHYMNIFSEKQIVPKHPYIQSTDFMLPIFCSALPALVSLGFFPYYAFGFNGVVGLMVASAFAVGCFFLAIPMSCSSSRDL